jgi:hypothetical protein
MMARPSSKKRAAAPPPPPEQPPMMAVVKLPIEPKGDAPTYYVNHAEVNITPFEMAITFARLPPRFTEDEGKRLANNEAVVIPATVQILLPVGFVAPLIDIMTRLKADHDRTFGLKLLAISEKDPNG